MAIDIPHIIVTSAVILGVLWIVDHMSPLKDASKGRRTIYKFIGIFVLLMIINLAWRPYGTAI